MTKRIRSPKIVDPRIAISKHIGWSKSYSEDSLYSIPEPDAYNYAICSAKPLSCQLLNFQIFYKLPKEPRWWSVYCVSDTDKDDFMEWLSKQQFDTYWSTKGGAALRKQLVSLF